MEHAERAIDLKRSTTRGSWDETSQDLAWIEAGRRGDPVAFNRLVLKWERRVYNLVLRMLGDPEESAEATQEIFLKTFRSIRNFKGDSRFSTWLYRIAVNHCITMLRRRPGLTVPLEEESEYSSNRTGLACEGTQEKEFLATERRREVLNSLSLLSAEQRAVIELKFFQEETFASMSEIVGVPISTIKSRFYAALEVLKGRLSSI